MAKKQKVSRRMRRYLNAGKAGLNKSAELSRRDLRRRSLKPQLPVLARLAQFLMAGE